MAFRMLRTLTVKQPAEFAEPDSEVSSTADSELDGGLPDVPGGDTSGLPPQPTSARKNNPFTDLADTPDLSRENSQVFTPTPAVKKKSSSMKIYFPLD